MDTVTDLDPVLDSDMESGLDSNPNPDADLNARCSGSSLNPDRGHDQDKGQSLDPSPRWSPVPIRVQGGGLLPSSDP